MLPRWLADAILFSPEGLQPFRVAGERIGWLRPDLLQLLLWRWSTVFAVREGGIVLNDRLTGARERTEAIAEVTHALRKAGWVRGWRDEHYAAIGETDGETKLTMERAAVKRFGVRARAAHLNGIVRGANGWSMWIATRSRSKQTEPGCLDNLVGGGMRAGASALDTLERESWEEAGIEAKLISQASAQGIVRFERAHDEGVDANHIYVFDLELSSEFVPKNQDGEVERFELLTTEEVRTRLAEPHRFTVDAALVTAACLERLR